MSKVKKLYYRLRYWRQLKKGFGLLSDLGEPKEYTLVNGKMFIANGVDPLVKVDLTTNEAKAYDGKAKFSVYYKAKAHPPKPSKEDK